MHPASVADDREPAVIGNHMILGRWLFGAAYLAPAIIGNLRCCSSARDTRVPRRFRHRIKICATGLAPIGVGWAFLATGCTVLRSAHLDDALCPDGVGLVDKADAFIAVGGQTP